MADQLKIKSGTKMQVAFDVPPGKEPNFNMVCTFHKAVDASAFLMSVPMLNGKALTLDENQKLLIRYGGQGSSSMILAGYADDEVRDGIRRYWKIRRVTSQHQYFQRVDERLKVALRLLYKQDTWPVNSDGEIVKDDGLSLDISNGGIAFFLSSHFDVGEVCQITLPRVGTSPDGKEIEDVIGVVCWCREAPKGSPYRNICGLQFRFANTADKETLARYVANIKKKFAL